MKNLVVLVIAGWIAFSCATVPVTGRKQLDLVNEEEIIQMSALTYDGILDTSKLSDDKEHVAMLKNVGARIKSAVEEFMTQNNLSHKLDGFDWEFNLIDDPKVVNAWAMPGGKVAFYTGIMPICQDETGIAVVMGHEVAHAVAGHGAERVSEYTGVGVLGAVASIFLGAGGGSQLTQEAFNQAFGLGAGLTLLSFSRKHESEADHIGLIFMALAGYHPSEAPKFWERMQGQSGGEVPPEFFSTHPSHKTRIEDLNSLIPEAMKYYREQD